MADALAGIAVVIITRDAATTLARTLDSVRAFSEVVIYDNGSSDGTQALVARYDNVRLVEGEFLGFGPSKRHAASLATRDWILSLDSDEALSDELVERLRTLDLSNDKVVYRIHRHNYFMGKRVRFSGWGSDWLVRLYNRKVHNYNDAMVHEAVAVNAQTLLRKLSGTIEHQAVTEVGQFLQKINRYSELRKEYTGKSYHPLIIVFKTVWAFIRAYLLRGGFLDGWRGLVIAVSNANGVFYKYIKAYAQRHTKEEA